MNHVFVLQLFVEHENPMNILNHPLEANHFSPCDPRKRPDSYTVEAGPGVISHQLLMTCWIVASMSGWIFFGMTMKKQTQLMFLWTVQKDGKTMKKTMQQMLTDFNLFSRDHRFWELQQTLLVHQTKHRGKVWGANVVVHLTLRHFRGNIFWLKQRA